MSATPQSVPTEHPSRDDQIRKLHYEGKSIRKIAKEVGCGVATVHRAVSGDDLIARRIDAAEDAQDVVNALRRAIRAARHGDVDGVMDATGDIYISNLDELSEDLYKLAEENSLDGPV